MSRITPFISSQPYEQFTQRGSDGNKYTYQNDAWNGAAGTQSISVRNNNDWSVVSNQPGVPPENGYVKTYPCLTYAAGKHLSQYRRIRAEHAEQGPGYTPQLQWEAAFDIWLNADKPGDNNGYEVMIWHDTSLTAYAKLPQPWAPSRVALIAGTMYDMWQGQGGNGPATWFKRRENAPSDVTHILDILKYVRVTVPELRATDPIVSTISYGWEVWGTSGQDAGFHCSKFGLEVS